MTKYRKVRLSLSGTFRGRSSGYIYAIRFGDRYKLGRTKNPLGRLTEMQSAFKQSYDECHFIPTDNAIEAERALFAQYQEQRLELEWFNLIPCGRLLRPWGM